MAEPAPDALPPGVTVITGWAAIKICRVERHGGQSPALPGFDAGQPPGSLQSAGGDFLAVPAPGEWLHFGPSAGFAPDPAFLAVDIAPGRLLLRLPALVATRALAAYCPLDPVVDLAPGRVARSLFADTDVLLAPDGATLLLIVDISFADHVHALLARLEH